MSSRAAAANAASDPKVRSKGLSTGALACSSRATRASRDRTPATLRGQFAHADEQVVGVPPHSRVVAIAQRLLARGHGQLPRLCVSFG